MTPVKLYSSVLLLFNHGARVGYPSPAGGCLSDGSTTCAPAVEQRGGALRAVLFLGVGTLLRAARRRLAERA